MVVNKKNNFFPFAKVFIPKIGIINCYPQALSEFNVLNKVILKYKTTKWKTQYQPSIIVDLNPAIPF